MVKGEGSFARPRPIIDCYPTSRGRPYGNRNSSSVSSPDSFACATGSVSLGMMRALAIPRNTSWLEIGLSAPAPCKTTPRVFTISTNPSWSFFSASDFWASSHFARLHRSQPGCWRSENRLPQTPHLPSTALNEVVTGTPTFLLFKLGTCYLS